MKGPDLLVRRKGLEPLTYWFVASHSIQLSYRRIPHISCSHIIAQFPPVCKCFFQKIKKIFYVRSAQLHMVCATSSFSFSAVETAV